MGVPVTTQAWRLHKLEVIWAATLLVAATSWASSSTTRQNPNCSSGHLFVAAIRQQLSDGETWVGFAGTRIAPGGHRLDWIAKQIIVRLTALLIWHCLGRGTKLRPSV